MTDDEIKKLQETLYEEFIQGFQAVGRAAIGRLDGPSKFIALTVLHSVHAQEVGRLEGIIEEFAEHAGIGSMSDLQEERQARIMRGRSLVSKDVPS